MTTLTDRDRTALVVIDMQNGVVNDNGSPDRDGVVSRIEALIAHARSAGAPVIWVQHEDDDLVAGTEAWEYVPELSRDGAEPLIAKNYPDAFEDTILEQTLAGLRVGSLIVTGAQTDCCVRATLHGAIARGYDAQLVADAHTTEDLSAHGAPPPEQVIAHTNMYWSGHAAPGRRAGTVAAADVVF